MNSIVRLDDENRSLVLTLELEKKLLKMGWIKKGYMQQQKEGLYFPTRKFQLSSFKISNQDLEYL